MDILMKYAKKKTVFILSTVLSGIVTLLYLISKFGPTTSSNVNINDINELAGTIGSMVTIIQIIFYLFIILAIVTAILSGVYFFKKNKQEYVMLGEFIVSCINSILLLLSMSGINAICKILRVAISGDYSSLMTMNSARLLSSVTSAASNLKYFMYLSIFVFIINIVLLLIVKKIINIEGFHFNFDEPVVTAVPAQEPVHEDSTTVEDDSTIADNELTQENGETETNTVEPNASETKPATINTQKIKDFFKTKNGKITIGVAAALIVCFGGYKIYDTFFNYTSIDLGKNITVEFTGKDGSGYIKDVESNIDYDKNNSDLSNFVSSTYTDYDFSGDLSNGDKITVTIKYSEELAKANKIKVTNDSKTFTVKGLIEKFKDSSKIPEKVITQLKKEADKNIKNRYKDGYSFTYNHEFNSLWFAKGEDDDNDSVIAIYKIDETYTSSFRGQQDVETYYAAIYVDDVDSAYLDEKSHYWYGASLYGSDGKELSDLNALETALKEKFDDQTLELIK